MVSTMTDTRTESALVSTFFFLRWYAVTLANTHDSQMLPYLLDPKYEHDYV